MQQLDVILQKLGGALLWQKALGLFVAVAAILGLYYQFVLSDIWAERERMVAEASKLEQEKKEYENRKKEYLQYRREIALLQDEQRDILRLLPKSDNIEQFVESLQQQIETAGLLRSALIRDPAVPQELFIRLPIKMTAFGTYHQLLRFFKSMREIPRIVNVENLVLATAPEKDTPDLLRADFITVAFQYLDRNKKPAGGAAAPGATMKPVAETAGGGPK